MVVGKVGKGLFSKGRNKFWEMGDKVFLSLWYVFFFFVFGYEFV